MIRRGAFLVVAAWLLVAAKLGHAQSAMNPRDTLAARQLEPIVTVLQGLIVTLRQPITLPVVTVIDSAALRATRDSLTVARADVIRLQRVIDSLSPVPTPVPTPTPTPAPTSAAATILTILGPTKTVTETAALGGVFAQYDAVFRQRLPAVNTDSGGTVDEAIVRNYYDRAVVFYAWYARSGDAAFLRRAQTLLKEYRRRYVEPNQYKIPPHQQQFRGLELHYRLTGDTMSRRAVAGMVANAAWQFGDPARSAYVGKTSYINGENRIQAKILAGHLSAYRMGASFAASGLPGGPYTPATWPTKLRGLLNGILGTQNADGSYSWVQISGGQANYMVGMLNDVLIEYYRDFEQDPRILSSVQRANEYLWATQWRPNDQAFNYFSRQDDTGGMTPAGDLNGLFIASFGWLYAQTGDAKWRTRGDAIMAGLVSPRWSTNYAYPKQFNQAFSEGYRYLGWR